MNKKIDYAIQLIKKYHSIVHVDKSSGVDYLVFLYDYVSGKKAIHTNKIQWAVNSAMRQQDYPKDVLYDQGMLYIKIESKPEIKESEEINEALESIIIETDSVVIEEPKKRKSKKTVE